MRQAKSPVTRLYDEDLLIEEEDLPVDDADAAFEEDDTLDDTRADKVA